MFFQSLHFNYSLDVHKINSVQKIAPPRFMVEQMEIACLYYNVRMKINSMCTSFFFFLLYTKDIWV